jgi:predicted extracellular nuclease
MVKSIAARRRAPSVAFVFSFAAQHIRRVFGGLILGLALLLPLPAFAAGKVVISQIYGGGGNSGATYKNDFIELFNSGDAPVDMTGWSVQYNSSGGTTGWTVTALSSANLSLQPGQYFLVQESLGAGGTVNLPTPDSTGTIAMSATAGKVALVNGPTALTGGATSCATASVVDEVSFGTGTNCAETAAAPAPSNTTADFRAGNGCTDSNNNSSDFATAAPAPRNTAATLSPCGSINPSGTGNAATNPVTAGQATLLTVAVTPGAVPTSTGISVSADLTAIGGSATQTLYDDASNGDVSAGDNVFSFNSTVDAATASGTESITATIKDAQGRSGIVTISLVVNGLAPTPPTGVGAANPASLGSGAASRLTVTVTPGTNPPSSNLVVSADLSAIGGSATQLFYDDGSNGDAIATDGVYSFGATVAPGTVTGTKALTATISDSQSRSSNATITVTVLPTLSIMDIQGRGAASTYAGQVVATDTARTNVVTAIRNNGFFVQDLNGDGDATTSDAVFIFTGTPVAPLTGPVYTGTSTAVGIKDIVTVTGQVQEFSGSTEISSSPRVTFVGTSASLPAAYDLSAHLPSTDPTQGVCIGGGSTIFPPIDGYQASNFACLDAMLVTMSDGVVTAPTFGAGGGGTKADTVQGFYATAAGNARPFRAPGLMYPGDPTHPGVAVFDGDPETVEIFFKSLPLDLTQIPNGGIYDAGQHFAVTGVMQGFVASGATEPSYEIYPSDPTLFTLIGAAPTYPIAVTDSAPGTLTIGTQNMLHFFNNSADGADTSQYTDSCNGSGSSDTCPTLAQYQARLQKMSLQIRTVLKAPVVQAVQEVENYTVLSDLANQIHTDDSALPAYVPYSIKGNDPGGINTGVLVRNDVSVNSVTQIGRDTLTDACSSGTSCLLNDRPPLLLDATFQGYHFRLLVIYDRSLINLGVNDYVGRKRRAQAEQVASVVQALQTTGQTVIGNTQQAVGGVSTDGSYSINGDAVVPLVVLGDFNAYEFTDGYTDVTGLIMGTADTDPAHSLYPPDAAYLAPSPALFDTGTAAAANDNYSYTFSGYAQEIDHILTSQRAHQDFVQISHAHGNADVSSSSPDVTSAGTARRSSDHDGQVVTLGFVVTPSANANGSISPATVQTVSAGAQPVFTLTPGAGYTPVVTGTCGGNLNGTTYTVLPVTTNCSVVASFALETFTVSPSAGANGSISPNTPQSVNYGGMLSFQLTPAVGYAIASVSGCNGSLSGNTYTTGPVSGDCAVSATFKVATYSITPSVGAGGQLSPNTVQTVQYNQTLSFAVNPDSGFKVANISGCGASLKGKAITTAPATADCTLSVTFAHGNK